MKCAPDMPLQTPAAARPLFSGNRERHVQRLLYIAGIAAATGALLFPVAVMTTTAINEHPDFLVRGFRLTGQHFHEILTTPSLHFIRFCINSFGISLISATVTTILASCGAYALTRFSFRGRSAVAVGMLALSMFPQICIAGYLFRLLATAGMINTWIGLILPYTAWIMPLMLWILISYFSQIPREIDRAAYVDGCSPLRTLVTVIAPCAAPGIFSTLLLAFIFSFNEFMFALMLTSDHVARTVPVGIALFQGLHGQVPWGAVMAASTLTALPVICMALLMQRPIMQGLTGGAIKE